MHADLILVEEKMVSAPLALILSRSFLKGFSIKKFSYFLPQSVFLYAKINGSRGEEKDLVGISARGAETNFSSARMRSACILQTQGSYVPIKRFQGSN